MPNSDPDLAKFSRDLRTQVQAGQPISGQTVSKPRYWIEISHGMSGYFAVMVWNGMGFPEPWESGHGRYGEPEPACVEARKWAAAEGIEFVEYKR